MNNCGGDNQWYDSLKRQPKS